MQHLTRLGAACDGGGDGFADLCGIANRAEHNLRFGVICNNVRCPATLDGADIQGASSEKGVAWQRNLPNVVKNLEQRVNSGMAQFWISRVREFSVRRDFISQRALRTEREMILRRLAIDKKSRAPRSCRGSSGPRAVAFFADNEEQSEIVHARGKEFFRRSDHRGDDALGIA